MGIQIRKASQADIPAVRNLVHSKISMLTHISRKPNRVWLYRYRNN